MNNTTERPVIFSAQEVNAVLVGHKTQHRVIVENPSNGFEFDFNLSGLTTPAIGYMNNKFGLLTKREIHPNSNKFERGITPCPLGKVGDRLWVQEDFIPDPPAGHDAWEDEDSVTNYFQWDGCGSKLSEIPNRLRTSEHVIYKAGRDNPDSMMWFNALQMRKWASRLLLEITDIRIERVQDIDAASAEVEGCFDFSGYERLKPRPLSAFITYWMAKHGDDAWFTNPWVWVIEFKKVDD
ncbi:hypothetical protein Q6344_04510 [Psychrobacter cibarius]|nr:hypothetical protein Q6344_04510 [Psychrobacter cibarius]